MNNDAATEKRLAIAAPVLYIVNLMLLPGLAFLVLGWLWLTRRKTAGELARHHLDLAFYGSVVAGILLVCVNLAIVLLGGLDNPTTWVVLILYFTLVHASLIVLGMVALIRALAGQRFALVFRREDRRG